METSTKTEKKVTNLFKKQYDISRETADIIQTKLMLMEANLDKESYSFSIQWNEKNKNTFTFFWQGRTWQLFEDDNKEPLRGYQEGLRGDHSLEHRLYFLAWLRNFLRALDQDPTLLETQEE